MCRNGETKRLIYTKIWDSISDQTFVSIREKVARVPLPSGGSLLRYLCGIGDKDAWFSEHQVTKGHG